MLAVFTILLLFSSLLTLRVFYLLVLHPLAKYPGPFLPKLTNFWRFSSFLKGSQHITDRQLHQRYGSFVRDGPDSLLVADIEAFKAIYGFTSTVEKGDFYVPMSNRKPHEPNIFSARTESQHRDVKKKLISTALSSKHVAQHEESVSQNIQAYLRNLHEAIKSKEGYVNVAPKVELLVFDTLLEATYGSSMSLVAAGVDRQGILAATKELYRTIIGVAHVPWLARLMAWPTLSTYFHKPVFDEQGHPKGLSAAGMWSRHIWSDALQGKCNLSPSTLKSLTEVHPSDNRRLSPDMIRYECFSRSQISMVFLNRTEVADSGVGDVLFAGVGSTAAGILAVLYEVATQPQWQDRLYLELDTMGGNIFPLSKSRLSTLPILQAVIKESLRLHPPFAGPFERVIGPGGELSIPKLAPLPVGTRIWSSQYVICRSAQIFEFPDDFRPERWLTCSQDRLKLMDDAYFVFGRGSRGCIGKRLGLMVIEQTVAAMLRRWHLRCRLGCLQGRNVLEMQYDELFISFTPRGDSEEERALRENLSLSFSSR